MKRSTTMNVACVVLALGTAACSDKGGGDMMNATAGTAAGAMTAGTGVPASGGVAVSSLVASGR